MSHANGKIYADTNYGVSIEDVHTVLGDPSTDLGTLCSSSRINKWSKVKPVRYRTNISTPYFGQMTPALYASVNFGFATDIDNSLVVTTPTAALNLLLAGSAYSYLQPNGATDNYAYRLTDFNGYNHNAPVPYVEYKYFPFNNRLPYFTLDKDTEAEILLSELSGFSDFEDLRDWSLYLVYRRHGRTGTATALPASTNVENCTTTIGGLDDGLSAYWRQGTSGLALAQYDYCFVIFNNDDGEPYYIPLPVLGTFTPTAYQPFTLTLPNLSTRYELNAEDGVIGGIRVPFAAEDVDDPFMIAIEVYQYRNNVYEKLNEQGDSEYITVNETTDSYAYGGQWGSGTAQDFDFLGVSLSDIDELYYRARIYNTADGRTSCFIPGSDILTPGTFVDYTPNPTQSQLVKLT